MEQAFYCIEGAKEEIVRKKSRFIARVDPISGKEEVPLFLEKVRRLYWDARHHCHAFVSGTGPARQTGCSDDGEPAKTAGRPILDVMLGRNLTDACVVVTRYFGGTLLGTGGLVRAYQDAALACLDKAKILPCERGHRVEYLIEYDDFARVRRIMEETAAVFVETEYGQFVRVLLAVPEAETERMAGRILSDTAGRASPLAIEETGFIRQEKGVLWKN